jgi:hypothetical protein
MTNKQFEEMISMLDRIRCEVSWSSGLLLIIMCASVSMCVKMG